MKQIILLILVMFSIVSLKPAGKTVGLKEAADAGLVDYSIHVNTSGTHYIRPFLLKITNQSEKELSVKIENGLKLIASDPDYQNFIITKEQVFVLQPGEEKTGSLYAMCTEHDDIAPGEQINYEPGNLASENMRVVSKYIEENKLFNTLGQEAVWVMSGDNELRDIAGFDTVTAFKLIRLVAKQLGIIDLPGQPDVNDYMRNFYCTSLKVWMGGEFEYKLIKERSIVIAMFDKNNIVVRELYNNPSVSAGIHTFEYEFDASYFTGDYYFIRMIKDGDIALEGKVYLHKKTDEQDD